jgi:diguanylate cyclase
MPEPRPTSSSTWSSLNGLLRARAPAAVADVSAPPAAVEHPPAATRQVLEQRFAAAHDPLALLVAFADGLGGMGGELADMGLRLQTATAEEDWRRCARLLRQLLDKYIRTIDSARIPEPGRSRDERLRDLGVQLLDSLGTCLQPAPLASQAQLLAEQVRQWQPGLPLEPLEQQLRQFDGQLRGQGPGLQEQRDLLMAVFSQLLDNICELLSPDSPLYREIMQLRPLLDDPPDGPALQQGLQSLREASYRQALLHERIGQATSALGHITPELAQHWADFATTQAGGQYLDRVRSLPLSLSQARNGGELVDVLNTLIKDTLRLQDHIGQLHAQYDQSQQALASSNQRICELETHLGAQRAGSGLDPLTGLPAATRLDTLLSDCMVSMPVLNVAMLAITGLEHCHREQGRALAQQWQQDFALALRGQLHADEKLLRLPEGLFVLLMPGTSLLAAQDRVMSLRRQLAGSGARVFRAAIMRWSDSLPSPPQLDKLEAGLPADDAVGAIELV